MKIDLHTHTRKIKSGDAETRDIDAQRFVDIIRSTEVKILAITNHNHFDLKQFREIKNGLDGGCQIWPGIELDILENNNRAHLLVICNPKNDAKFDKACTKILSGKDPNTFTISLVDTVTEFDKLECIYIAHYRTKKPSLSDEDIEVLYNCVSNGKRVIKEATNSISAGIYISHGHNSIYGSDVHNWDEYISLSKDLPDLRLPVESFEQFCLLLEKDEATINTLLSKKIKENIQITPFGNAAEIITLDIYNDINILFGSKGTGKTDILEALSKYFNGKGHKTNVYKSSEQHLKDVFDLKGDSLSIDAENLGFEECQEEISFIREASELRVTSLEKYIQHYSTQETNKISKLLKIKNITKADEKQPKRKLKDALEVVAEFETFIGYVQKTSALKDYVGEKQVNDLVKVLNKIIKTLSAHIDSKFIDLRSVRLLNQIISVFVREISKKTGQPEKPTKTGFSEYAGNRIKIELCIRKILSNINKELQPSEESVGSLGKKGELFCKTNLVFQTGKITDRKFDPVKPVGKTLQKNFINCIHIISKHIYSNDLFEKIATLNEIDNVDEITSLSCLLLFNKHFTLDGKPYEPSNGESSMILLFKEFKEEKDIYLIDEPERSLGNDYINDVIVPLIKEKALLGKKVIIATHDANIAVRTLPYNSIYRLYENNQHYTMCGNPFSNSLKCIHNSRGSLDWKEISMKTLEGGKDAFNERGKIYGN